MRPRRALYLLPALALAACSAASGPSATPPASPPSAPMSLSPGASASTTASLVGASPSARPTTDPSGGDVIVTFRTAGDEEFRILLTDAADIRMAERLLAGRVDPVQFPNGLIVRGGDGGVNTGYSWHIDPESVQFAQFSTEACDGRPSYVEDGSHTSERFCPWTAVVVEIEPAD